MARPQGISDEDILSSARACFLEHGPSVSTTVIAERLGVSQATLFKRFGTKEELLVAALMPPAEPPSVRVLRQGPQPGDLRPQLRDFAMHISVFFEGLVPCIAMLRAAGISHEDLLRKAPVPPPLAVQRALSAWLGRAQANGQIRAIDTEAVAVALIGALQARPFLQHITGGEPVGGSADQYVTALVDLLWQGLRPISEPGVS